MHFAHIQQVLYIGGYERVNYTLLYIHSSTPCGEVVPMGWMWRKFVELELRTPRIFEFLFRFKWVWINCRSLLFNNNQSIYLFTRIRP